jgi:hypothetical protein
VGASLRRHVAGVLHSYGELWRLARVSRDRLFSTCALLAGAQVVLLGTPYCAARAINVVKLEGASGLPTAGLWLSIVLLLVFGGRLLRSPGQILERNVALKLRRRISVFLLEQLIWLPLSWSLGHFSAPDVPQLQPSSMTSLSIANGELSALGCAVRFIGRVHTVSP